MKLLGRIGIILLVALAVAGATLAVVNNGALDSLGLGGGDGDRPAMAQSDGERPAMGDFDGERPTGGRGERDGGGGVASFLAGLGRNLGTILVIVAGVVAGQWLWSLVSRRKAKPGGGATAEKPPENDFV